MDPRTTPGDRRSGERGYTLVALMIGLTVMMILITAVLPSVSAEMQRTREDELIFRGMQYAEGIRVFHRKYGRYPNTLKEMIETHPRTLRKLWKDPMVPDGQWALIGVTAPLPGVPAPGGPGGGGLVQPTPSPSPTPTPSPFANSGGFGTPGTGGQVGPITGVRSKSTKKGFRTFQGRDTYSEWQFTEQTLFAGGTGSTGQPVATPGPGVGGVTTPH